MTTKIDPALTIALKPIASSPFSQAVEDSDFKSILEERLATSKPLELMMVQFLSHTLEAFLSRPADEEDDFFAAPAFALKPSAALPQKTDPVFPQQVVVPQIPGSNISVRSEVLEVNSCFL